MASNAQQYQAEETSERTWPRIAIVGAGAVGGYFGGLLARAGAPVVMIGRKAFVEAVDLKGILLDTVAFNETVRVEVSTELSAASGADVVLFCVKSTDTVGTARELGPYLSPEAVVLSLQNGVDNAAKVTEAAGVSAYPAVVYLAASVPEPGWVKHTGRGDLVIGSDLEHKRSLSKLFIGAGIGCRVSDKIYDDLWEKFICNCALNAISALCKMTYGEIGKDPETWRLVQTVIGETMDIARASGRSPTNMADHNEASATVFKLTQQIAGAYSSTAQDLVRKRPTEIDSLNGFVARRGRELGKPTPVNQTLLSLIKAAENAGLGKETR